MKPGAKYYEWELLSRPFPLALELGPRDLASTRACSSAGDTRVKRPVSLSTLGGDVSEALSTIQREMLAAGVRAPLKPTACASASRRPLRELMDGRPRGSSTPVGVATGL